MSNRPDPLRVLGLRLMVAAGIPSLGALIGRFGDIESYQDFVRLVREYLPEREADILGHAEPGEQVAAFADYFEDRYFPLWPMLRDGAAEGYADLTYHIPVTCRGVSCEDYELIASEWREGYQLLTWLAENPWGTTDGQGVFHPRGPQVSLAEACEAVVGAALLERLPAGGLPPAELHRLFDKTRYRAVAMWADILHQDTGCEFLDNDEDSMGCTIPPEWCREEVEHLTKAWHQGELLYNQVVELVGWLEEDLKGHFAVLVNIIEQRGGAIRERNGKPEGVQLELPLGDSGDAGDTP